MNKDQVKGRAKEVKGTVKEMTGRLVGNKKLETKGKVENATGRLQADLGDIKQDIKDGLEKS